MPSELPGFDLYATLQVDHRASVDVIAASWKALQKRHYPRAPGEGDADLSRRLNIAYEWLSDPTLRARYDAARHPSGPGAFPPRSTGRPSNAAPPPTAPRTHAWPPSPTPPSARGIRSEPPQPHPDVTRRPAGPPFGLTRVMRVPAWQRRVVAFVGTLLIPLGLAGMVAKSSGGPVAGLLGAAALVFPTLVVALAWGTDRYSDIGLRRATRGVQRLVVAILAIALLSPIVVVLAVLPKQLVIDGVNAVAYAVGAVIVIVGIVVVLAQVSRR